MIIFKPTCTSTLDGGNEDYLEKYYYLAFYIRK